MRELTAWEEKHWIRHSVLGMLTLFGLFQLIYLVVSLVFISLGVDEPGHLEKACERSPETYNRYRGHVPAIDKMNDGVNRRTYLAEL